MSEAAAKGVHLEIQELKGELSKLQVDLNAKIGNLETEVRVVKHDFANLKEMINGVGARVDKMEERVTLKIDQLGEKLASTNVQQAKGVGFFAGMGAVIALTGAVLLALIKVLFGQPPV